MEEKKSDTSNQDGKLSEDITSEAKPTADVKDLSETVNSEEIENVDSKSEAIPEEEKPQVESEEVSDEVKSDEKAEDDSDEIEIEVEEVETDDHQDDDAFAKESLEIPDYASMNNPTLIQEATKLLNESVTDVKEHFEIIKNVLFKSLDEERTSKLKEFVEEGNSEIDFHYEQPIREKFKQIYRTFKKKREEYFKELSQKLAMNLEVKKQILEDIKNLPDREDLRVPEKYKQFRDLQERWKEVGAVPKNESRDLYNNYHFHVHNFYDFLHISNELRELDFKKNLEQKEILCEKAEALAETEISKTTFPELQEMHKAWREIGPVDREHNDAIWERFSEATRKIHDKRHEHFEQLKLNQEERLAEKEKLCSEIEEKVSKPVESHGGWQKAIKELEELRKKFKSFGPIHHPKNDEIWERFREANRKFNKAKNNFYKELKKQQSENLKRKRDLLERAQAIMDSDDWKETADELKRIQRDWKKIGYVQKAQSDKIWKEFREACNHFFNRLTEQNKKQDQKYVGHLEEKKALLAKLQKLDTSKDPGKSKAELTEFITEWRNVGRVPRENRDIEKQFNLLLDEKFDALNLEKKESALIRFENKILSFLESDDQHKIDKEFDFIRQKIEEAKKEMIQLQNNISFFAHVDENNPMVKEVRKNINRHKDHIELLKSKIIKGKSTIHSYNNPEKQDNPDMEEAQDENTSED